MSAERKRANRRIQRVARISKAADLLKNDGEYAKLDPIGSGTYGRVYKMVSSLTKQEWAAKFVPFEIASNNEVELWPKLNHPNLVSLKCILKLPNPKVFIFIMPLYSMTLHLAIQDAEFRGKSGAFKSVKSWLKDMLRGLEYLHLHEMCHLDLKLDNILISESNTALLADFTFLWDVKKALTKRNIGLPRVYKPPEAFIEGHELDGFSVDMWGFGCMVVELCTYFGISRATANIQETSTEIQAAVLNVLEEQNFKLLLMSVYDADIITEAQSKLALTFIQEILKSEASERLQAGRAILHEFFNEELDFSPQQSSAVTEFIDQCNIEDHTQTLMGETGDDKKMTMEEKLDLVLLKLTELSNEVKHLHIRVDGMAVKMEVFEKLVKRNPVVDKSCEKETVRIENNGMGNCNFMAVQDSCDVKTGDKSEHSSMAHSDEAMAVSEGNTKAKCGSNKKRGALNWMRKRFCSFKRLFRSFRKNGSK